jgi:hypothetical protein
MALEAPLTLFLRATVRGAAGAASERKPARRAERRANCDGGGAGISDADGDGAGAAERDGAAPHR